MNNALFIRIQEALEKIQFPQVVGAIIFGSMAKGTETLSSDIDLLIICNGIHAKRQRRGEEIMRIKKDLPELPMDILLFTPQEVESNFQNHNPLFLDITEEGVILVDDQGWLENLMEETRNYIKHSGIRKTEYGWVFPVTRGVLTYLSKISNKDFSLAMVKDGERDYLIGQNIMDSDYYDKSVYHFQQAVEKCIKAVLIAMGIFQKTHLVGETLRVNISAKIVPAEWREELIKLADISESLEPEVSLSRYPAIIQDHLWLPFEEYEKQDAENAMGKAAYVLTTAKRFVEDWFSSQR